MQEIESHPIDVRQCVIKQRGSVCRVGDGVMFARKKRLELLAQFAVQLRLLNTANGARLKHRS